MSGLKITVKESRVHERDAGDWIERYQWALYHSEGMEFPFKIPLGKTGQPYQAGEYQLSESSFQRTQYDKLTIGRINLEPLRAELKKAS